MLSGRVVDRKGNPVEGVVIRIVGDSTDPVKTLQGSTKTTSGGRFDFRVFGGRTVTLAFEKAGFLPVQRQVKAPLDGYGNADVIALTPAAPASPVKLGANGAWASGVQVTDSAGPRTARIFFPAGITAYDGSAQLPSNLDVRLTEFTVGADGPAAMPGTLPPSTAYTYAADFSINGKESRTISFKDAAGNPAQVFAYVEDILADRSPARCLSASALTKKCTKLGPVLVKPKLKVGTVIPSGSYDTDSGAWKPGPNGQVIRILSVSGGLAVVDTTGDGNGDNTGLSTEERKGLAATYGVGSQLWRVPIPHFSPWDFNFPFGPCAGCKPPGNLDPKTAKAPGENLQDGAMCTSGSVIQCENQVVGESVPVLGTSLRLAYASDRVPGRTSEKFIEVPLTNPQITDKIPSKVHLETAIAGQVSHKTYTYGAPSKGSVFWNGLDAQGRRVQGAQKLHLRLGYEYPAEYYTSQQAAQQVFLALGGYNGFDPKSVQILQGKEGASSILWRDWLLTLENFNAQPLGLGGWTLSAHHTLDPVGGTLYRGDGSTFQPRLLGATFKTLLPFNGDVIVAGPGQNGTPTDGVLAVLPDGNLLVPAVNSGDDFYLFQVDPQGKVSIFAGKNQTCSLDDNGGGDPKLASLCKVKHISVSKDGTSVYLASENANNASRLKRIFRDPSKGPGAWSIETLAGTACQSNCSSSGDDGPAKQANFTRLNAVAPGPDGSLFVRDDTALRRILPDGRIVRMTGNAEAVAAGKILSQTYLGGGASSLVVDSQGRIYFLNKEYPFLSDNVFRIDSDGVVREALNKASPGIFRIALDPEDRLLVLQEPSTSIGMPGRRIQVVQPDGSLQPLVAGLPEKDASNGLAYSAHLRDARGLVVDGKGRIVVDHKDKQDKRFFSAIEPLAPQVSNADLVVPEPSGEVLHVFSSAGQHLRTVLASTGHALWSFEYDTDGLLTGVLDRDGRKTTVVRSGKLVTLTSPDGHETELTLDAADWLAKVSYPAAASDYPGGVAFSMQHRGNGLLESFTDPRGNQHLFQYGFFGRLVKDSQPASAGGSKSLAMTRGDGFWQVAVSTAEGRTTTHRAQFAEDGTRTRTHTSPEGAVSSLIEMPDHSEIAQTRPTAGAPVLTESLTKLAPDALFGMAAPRLQSSSVTLYEPGKSSLTSAPVTYQDTSPAPTNGLLAGLSRSSTLTVAGLPWSMAYDASTRVQTLHTPPLLDTATSLTFSTTLDSKGRPTVIVLPWAAQPIVIEYASIGADLGRISKISQGTRTLTPSYSKGFFSGMTAPENMSLAVPAGQLDALGRPHQLARSGLSSTLDLDYDKSGNLTSLTPPGKPAHTFSHDTMDREESYTPPAVSGGGTSSKIVYTKDGNPASVTTPGGRVFSFDYSDAKKRLHEVAITATGLATPDTYALTLDYDDQQRLKTLSDSTGEALSFGYHGPLLQRVTSNGSVAGSISFAHDDQFRIASESINDASTITYAYDNDSTLRSATLDGVVLQHTRNAKGLRVSSSLSGTSISTPIVTSYSYDDAFGELSGLTVKRGSTTLFSYAIEQRDDLGREKSRREQFSLPLSDTRTIFEYDAAGRLATAKACSLIEDIPCTSASYTYDDNGNPTSSVSPSTLDAQDRLLSSGVNSFEYNAEGWRTKRSFSTFSHAFTYHPAGHLRSADGFSGSAAYVFDPLGRRIVEKGTFNNTPFERRFLFRDSLRPAAELDASNTLHKRFVYASDRNVPDFFLQDDTPFLLVSDPRGSVRLVVNAATGGIEQEMGYNEWGVVMKDTAPGRQPFGFGGGVYEAGTGLVHFGAREYNPALRRWQQKDPIGFGGGDSNLYAYVGNDPVNYTDPTGLWLLQVTGAALGAGAQAWTNYDAYACGRISGEKYAGSIVLGAVVGALGTIPTSVVGGAIAGGLGSVINEQYNQDIGAKSARNGDFLKAFGIGAFAGGAANVVGALGNQIPKPEGIIGKSIPLSPIETYGELGGAIGTALGTVWANK